MLRRLSGALLCSLISVSICLQCMRPGFDPWVGKIVWRREQLPTPVFWPGEVCIVHGVTKSWTQLSNFHTHTHKPYQLTVLQTSTQVPEGDLGEEFEWFDAVPCSQCQKQHGDHNEAGFVWPEWEDIHKYLPSEGFWCMSLPLHESQREAEGIASNNCTLCSRTNLCIFSSGRLIAIFFLFLPWKLNIGMSSVSFLSWLNILVLSMVRKFVLVFQHVSWLMQWSPFSFSGKDHLKGEREERSHGLRRAWYNCHYPAVYLLEELLCKTSVHRNPR